MGTAHHTVYIAHSQGAVVHTTHGHDKIDIWSARHRVIHVDMPAGGSVAKR